MEFIDFIIRYLNSNSGLITAFATVVAASATVVLAIITRRYVQLTDSLLKATYKPQIFISLRSERFNAVYRHNIYVENVGVGVARKVRFGGDTSFKTEDAPPLNQLDFIKNGIDALSPGRKMKFKGPPDRALGFKPKEKYPLVSITVIYKDSMGGDHDDEFTLDFNDRNYRVESGSS